MVLNFNIFTLIFINLLLISCGHKTQLKAPDSFPRPSIEEQFTHMISKEDVYCIAQYFRDACGGHAAYPSIHGFVEYINQKSKPGMPQKNKIA